MDMTSDIEELKRYFRDAGITQTSIAEAMGTSTQYISGILNGKLTIGKKTAAKLQEIYGISSAWILTGQGSMLVDDDEKYCILDGGEPLRYFPSRKAPDAEERIEFLEEQVLFYKKQVEVLQKLLLKD